MKDEKIEQRPQSSIRLSRKHVLHGHPSFPTRESCNIKKILAKRELLLSCKKKGQFLPSPPIS